MAGYQILGIRSFFDEKTRKQKKYDAFFEQRWRFDNIEEIFTDPVSVMDRCKVPLEERYNLYYTVNISGDTKRKFLSAEILPFDLDGIDTDRTEDYVPVILKVLGVERDKTAIVFSGNGLHFLVKLPEAETDKKYFTARRSQYRAICARINAALESLRLRGKADLAVFDAARILRFPETLNIKPDKHDLSKLIEKKCYVLQPTLTAQSFNWEKVSGEKILDSSEAIPLADLGRYRTNDGIAAFEECLFLKDVKADPARPDEPELYAALSIIGRFKNGVQLAQEVFQPRYGKRSNGGTPEDIAQKTYQAVQASGPRTCGNINSYWGKCIECPLYQKITSPVVIVDKNAIPTEATGYYDLIPTKDGPPKRIPNYNDLLAAYRRAHPFKTIADMKTVYTFNGTHYIDTNPIEIKGFAEQHFNPDPSDKIRNEFLSKVLANEVARKKFFTVGTENRINFKNGVLDLGTNLLAAHSPDFGFRAVQPYDYDPDAECPTFDWWINDIMLADADLVKILQEFMGYVLRGGDYKYHKALWLAGTGRNGKSTFIDVLKALIGHENYGTLSIKQIIGDKFASSMLDGKFANFSEETSPEELSDSGPFKNLTGDGEVNAQKKYGDPYQFRNRAKLIMSYNEVPVLKDLSPGMLSRPIIIPFKRDLTQLGAQDRNLKAKLFAELPGILNFALEGWRRLEEHGDFTHSDKSSLEMQEIQDASCSAMQWARENIELLPIDNVQPIKPRVLYAAYRAEIGQYAYSENKFLRRLQALPGFAARKHKTERGIEYSGIKLRSNIEKISSDF